MVKYFCDKCEREVEPVEMFGLDLQSYKYGTEDGQSLKTAFVCWDCQENLCGLFDRWINSESLDDPKDHDHIDDLGPEVLSGTPQEIRRC